VMAHFLVRAADVFMCTICKSGSVFLFTDSSTFQWRCVAEVEERQVLSVDVVLREVEVGGVGCRTDVSFCQRLSVPI
jgi:hypothetical protein